MAFWSALAMLPDADVIGFRFGVSYGDPWGHRGATHSVFFAVVVGAMIGAVAPVFGRPRVITAAFAIATIASHALLDTLTTGGLGCALLWPFDTTRYFAPWQIIPVAPLGRGFWTMRGLTVAAVEVAMFLPLFTYALWPRRPGIQLS
jgi:inner membrane protein